MLFMLRLFAGKKRMPTRTTDDHGSDEVSQVEGKKRIIEIFGQSENE